MNKVLFFYFLTSLTGVGIESGIKYTVNNSKYFIHDRKRMNDMCVVS